MTTEFVRNMSSETISGLFINVKISVSAKVGGFSSLFFFNKIESYVIIITYDFISYSKAARE